MTDPGGADLPGRLVLRVLWRTFGVTAVFLVLFAGFVVWVNLETNSANELAATGVHVPGVVTTNYSASKYGGSMDVRFAVDGVERTAEINLNGSSPSYHQGESVTVIYDHADPGRVRTDGEDNESGWSVAVLVVLLIVGVVPLPPCLFGLARWVRRVLAVWRGEWKPGVARGEKFGRNRLRLDVEFDSGTRRTIETVGVLAIPDMREKSLHVQVGGRRRALVVYFEDAAIVVAAKPARRQPRSPVR